ncbi:MAG: choice-of-anchor D domain-containing protein [Myxococcales bacterium]|nr:choice-of-anchor D domain-containing protein [Myxococcales bacterium]
MRVLFPLLFAGCDPDQGLNAAEPKLVFEPATIDFGEVVVGTYSEIGAMIRNEGLGSLRISGAEFEGGASADLSVVSWPGALAAGEAGLLVVRYTPDVEGEDWGTLHVASNQSSAPTAPVTLTGLGVRPCIDIDPELLWFGTIVPGESVSRDFQVRAGCTGTLRIGSAAFPGDEAVAYSLSWPEDWAEPYVVRTGFSFTVGVTFSPPDTTEWSGELWFASNDPDDSTAAVQLRGNTVDDPTDNEPPYVEITEPDVGEYFLDNQLVTLNAVVYDADEAPTNLICGWYVNGSRSADADATIGVDGTIAAAVYLPVGDVEIELRCYDSEGEQGADSTRVDVWKHDEPLQYVISGGSTVFDYFTIDDDLRITIDGVVVFDDDNDAKDTLAPVTIAASVGDTLELLAVDQNSCDAVIDPLVLHWGTGRQQALNEGVCRSACPDHACYDGSYAGPWPSVLLEEGFLVAIP